MIKLLAISGSPVEGASTDVILKMMLEAVDTRLSSDAEVTAEFVKISDLKFIPCQSCGEAPEEGFCLYEDDLTPVYDSLAACDLLLFGSPVYFDSVSAHAKMFIDRCNCFRPPDWKNKGPDRDFIKLLNRKRPGAMVMVGGERGWFEGARRVIAGFFKWIEVVNEGKLVYHSCSYRERGTAANDAAVASEIAELADHLANKIREAR